MGDTYREKNYPTKNSSKKEIKEFIDSIPPNTKILRGGGLKMVLRKKSDMKKKGDK